MELILLFGAVLLIPVFILGKKPEMTDTMASPFTENLLWGQERLKRLFWITGLVLAVFLFTVWMTWELAREDVLVRLSPILNSILVVLFIEMIFISVQGLRVRASLKSKPKINIADEIERLHSLKEKGMLTVEEYERQKSKILN